MRLSPRTIFTTIAVTCIAFSSQAYTTNGWWNQSQVGMYASAVSFPPGNSLRTGVGQAVARFNLNPSQFRIGIHYDDNHVSRANFESEIWATTNWRWDNPAIEFTRYGANGRILASDILFDANLDYWTASTEATDLWPYNGDGRPFQGTLLHELCHSAGLGHEDGEYNLMGQEWRHVHRRRSIVTCYVGEDASDGLVSIYGRRSGESIEDLSAAHFKWVADGGEYSEHFRTLMYTTGGQELPFTAFSGMRRYNVNKGQQVQIEFTYENNGETSKSGISIGFYISVDDLVTTGDQLIGTRTFNLTRGDVATRKDTFTIPNNLVSGQTYYLGVVVDRTSTFPEVDEDNNRAFHIIRVN